MTNSLKKDLVSYLRETLFHRYQIEILDDTARRIIILKARRIGVSWTMTLKVLLHALRHEDHKFFIVTTKLENAKSHLEIITDQWIPLLFSAGFDCMPVEKSRSRIILPNKSKIISSTTNIDSIRGESASIYFDEGAYPPAREQDKIMDALLPMSGSEYTPNTVFWMVSTPAGPDGAFHEIFTEETSYPRFSRHEIDIYTAMDHGFSYDRKRLDHMNSRKRAREFECSFTAIKDAFFSREHLLSLETDATIDRKKPASVGIDLGKKNDLTAIVIRQKNLYGALYLIDGQDYVDQIPLITNLLASYNVETIHIDATRTETVTELIQKHYEEDEDVEVKGIHSTHKWKKSSIEGVDEEISRKKVRINFDQVFSYNPDLDLWNKKSDRRLLTDTLSVAQKQTLTGKITYKMQRDSTGHGDAFAAKVLAYSAHHAESSYSFLV